jgi:hypothetical protein
MTQEYIQFKIKREKVESLIHSYNYHANILKYSGRPVTGTLYKFMDELNKRLSELTKKEVKE